MSCRVRLLGLVVSVGMLALGSPADRAQAEPKAPATIVVGSARPTFPERLAAQEIRRYVYVRCGTLLPIVQKRFEELKSLPDGPVIAVGHLCRLSAFYQSQPGLEKIVAGCRSPDGYLVKTIEYENRPVLVISGSVLYAAYRFAEHLGVRFDMHGDTVPDQPIAWQWPKLDEAGCPLFDRRGIQPFHDFPEGPDWWNADAYKAVLGQLPKMRMNFFGLHTYPEGGVGPEPLTWIGAAQDIGPDGTVKFSYPSRHFITMNPTGAWGYRPTKTSDYFFGAAWLFDRDDYGADYMRDTCPWNRMSPQQSNDLFARMGVVLNDAFSFARSLGIKTCIGTETPLTIPAPVRERLKKAGKNVADPAVAQEVYEGMFRRIMDTHPLDYYWLWTDEGWTWAAVKQQQIDRVTADFRAALAAAEKLKAPFALATCGWVLGPPQQPSLFDDMLPKSMPLSCISRMVGNSPVEPGFARVEGRPKWSIPWMEDDPGLTIPQLWAGRMRRDAADSLAYGCTGLMGIHWRTRCLGPNVSALAKAMWDQRAWNPNFGKKPDPALAKLPEGAEGGQVVTFPQPVAGTTDAPLYQSVRYDVKSYRIDVPNGKYAVTLKFCEPHYAEKGKRVFGVNLQGTQVIEHLDIFAKVGRNRALDYTFNDIRVANGQLVIDFPYEVEFSCIAAVAIEGPVTRKINCGGPAYKDYAADFPAAGPGKARFLPVDDFYADWALAEFGPQAAGAIAKIFSQIDGRLPRPADWVDGPGGIKPDPRPWDEVAKSYTFVADLAALRGQVQGAGNLERFDYWLDNMRYLRTMGQANCTWARFDAAMRTVRAEKDPEARRKLARELALPVRKELVAQVADIYRHLLATVSTYGELGNVTNWEQHLLWRILTAPGDELAKILGEPLPAEAMPPKEPVGPPRLIVPVVRTALVAGEPLNLTVLVSGVKPPAADAGALYWRALGAGQFAKVPLAHVARGVYRVTLPAQAAAADFEYYVQVTADGAKLSFPPTAPVLNQSVVVVQP